MNDAPVLDQRRPDCLGRPDGDPVRAPTSASPTRTARSFTYTVSSVSGGYFQLSGAPGTPITSFTSADLTGGLVQFVDDGNEVAPSFDVTVNDGTADSNTLQCDDQLRAGQ